MRCSRWASLFLLACLPTAHAEEEVAPGEARAALAEIEARREPVLRATLAARADGTFVPVPEDLRGPLAEATAGVSAARAELERARETGSRSTILAARRTLGEALAREAEVSERVRVRPAEARRDENGAEDGESSLRAALRPGEVLVLYDVPASGAARAVVLGAKASGVVPLGPAPTLADAVEAADLSTDRGDLAEAFQRLRGFLVDPIAASGAPVEGATRWIVSPSGVVWNVAFAALRPDLEWAVVPSGTVLSHLRRLPRTPGQGVLALGDPDRTPPRKGGPRPAAVVGPTSPRLPASREEARTAAGEDGVLLLGAEGTETRWRATLASRPRWRALHLAASGLANRDQPLQSAILLGADEAQDGYLTLVDLLGLSTPADLVVLST